MLRWWEGGGGREGRERQYDIKGLELTILGASSPPTHPPRASQQDTAQQFSYDGTTFQLKQPTSGHCVDVHSGGPIVWMYGCTNGANDQLKFNAADGTLRVTLGANNDLCFGVEAADPAGATFASTIQAWAKPLSKGQGVALLMINPDTQPHAFDVPISALPQTGEGKNLTGSALHVRDIWTHSDGPQIPAGSKTVSMTVPGMASAFVRLYE